MDIARRRPLATNLSLALVYFAAAKLGLSLAYIHPSVSSVWPPSAIGLVAALVLGRSVWPGIFAGAFAINLATTAAHPGIGLAAWVLTSAGIATGNTLEAVVGAWAVARFAEGERALERAFDFLKFALFGALLSTMISASFGTLSLAASGALPWGKLVPAWTIWWLGDAAGILLWAPLLLACMFDRRPLRVGYLEAAGLALFTALSGWHVFFRESSYPTSFLIMPCLIWCAFRFGLRGTAVWVLAVSCGAATGTALGHGSFAKGYATDMLVLQIFLGILAVSAYATAALIREGEESESLLRDSRNRLEVEVDRRTRELLQAQKMEAVGRLSGVVAHEFNNALTGIAGLAELIRQDSAPGSQTGSDAMDIAAACRRGAALAGRLLTLSRRQAVELKPVDLNELIRANEKMLRLAVGERTEFEVSLAPDAPAVLAVGDQLEQIVLNLCLNARDAMSGAGKITVATAVAREPADRIVSHGALRAGRYVVLSLSDTGAGIAEDILPMIFEPFFTTKSVGRGSGLGLSVVYGIIESHRGAVDVETRPGRTVFRLYFPATDAAPEKTPQPARASELPRGSETLLIADDDELVRAIITRSLEPLGYRLLVAKDGEEAWRLYRENEASVAMAVLDVVMPKLRGDEVYARISGKNPKFKVLFISGYSTKEADKAIRLGGLPMLRKPFPLNEIGASVRAILDGR